MMYGRNFPLEDVFVGLLLEEMPDVKALQNAKYFKAAYNGKSTGCDLNNLFVAHRALGSDQIKLLKMARQALIYCKLSFL